MSEKIIQFGETPDDKTVSRIPKPPEEPEIATPALIDPDFQVPTKQEEREADQMNSTQVQAAVQLRLLGAGYPEIAKTLGYMSASTVRVAVIKAIAETHSDENDYRSMRALQSMRYEALLKSLSGNAFTPTIVVDRVKVPNPSHLPYLREARAVIKEIAVLHGLNAPQVHALVTPDSESFEGLVNMLTTMHHEEHDAEEGDIMEIEDADVVEEGEPDA